MQASLSKHQTSCQGLWLAAALLFMLGCLNVPRAEAVPFFLDVGLSGQSADRLEVASDSEFKQLVVQLRIGQQTSYPITIDKSGRYFFRTLQHGQEIQRETIIIALEPPPSGQLFKVTWKAVDAQASYRLSFSRADLKKTWVLSSVPQAYLGGRGVPWMMRVSTVIPGKAGSLPVQDLQLIAAEPPPKPAASAARSSTLQIDPFAADDDQVSSEPEYKDLLKGSERSGWKSSTTAGAADVKPLRRPHRVYAFVKKFNESFSVDRLDRYASPKSGGIGSGAGGSYFVQPTLRLSLDIDTHATKTSYEVGGTSEPAEVQKRVRLSGAAGVDVLNLETRRENLSLYLGPAFAFLQLPIDKDNQAKGDIGAQLSFVYFPWRLETELRYFKSGSNEAMLNWSLPWPAWVFSKKKGGLRPYLSLYQRLTKASENDASSHFEEAGARLGIELSL